jgi:uncharacterized protein
MKKTTLFLAFCLLANLTFAQGKEDNQNIVIGKTDSIQSKILGEKRKIWVHVPDGANQKYPVVYVLDGDGHFSSVVVPMIRTVQHRLLPNTMLCAFSLIISLSNSA